VRVIVNSPAEAIGQLIRVPDPSAASSTIQDALQNLPGISSTTGSKDESNIRLRGFRKNEVKIMVDGRPLITDISVMLTSANSPRLTLRKYKLSRGLHLPCLEQTAWGE
jgi:hypothetical protein